MDVLAIDIETYSSIDLTKCGVYRYVEAEDFEVLLFAYAYNQGPVTVVDLAQGEKLPWDVMEDLSSPDCIKTAYNANFERVCLAQDFNLCMPPEQWECTKALAATLGLPSSLDEVAKALKLDQQKAASGKALIRYFSVPQTRRASGGLFPDKKKNRNMPQDSPEKWEQFKAYCAQDVETERAIRLALAKHPMLDMERRIWHLDQHINDQGVEIDELLVAQAIKCAGAHEERLMAEAIELTGMDNPKSVAQVKAWLKDAEGLEVESLNKATVPDLLQQTESDTVKRMLEIRQELSKSSVKKYEAMERSVCSDGRIRGLFQYYGANRSGRWASRLVQVQNLPQNHLEDLDLARQLLRSGDFETLELLYGNVPDTLSQLLRTALVAGDGRKFVVADFSAIEARIIAWLAGEEWRMEVFRTHGKIYEASASQMFKVPIEQITKGNPLRQKGKIAELALGYGGSVGALKAMGALKMGLEEAELKPLVTTWRNTNPAITALWWAVEEAAIEALMGSGATRCGQVSFTFQGGILFVSLPSGRSLAYVRPRIENDSRYGRTIITYEGYGQGKWKRLKTYGPKLVENIVQGIARDCLAAAMVRLDDRGYGIVMHVHDEVVIEAPLNHNCLKDVCHIMGEPLTWAKGLPLPAAGYETYYYKKD